MSATSPSSRNVKTALGLAVERYRNSGTCSVLGSERVQLPSRYVLCGLDDAFSKVVDRKAIWVLQNLFVPAVLCYLTRRRRAEAVRDTVHTSAATLTTTLSSSDVFRMWPRNLVLELAETAHSMVFNRGEFIYHDREPSFAVAIFVQGSATVATRSEGSTVKGFQEGDGAHERNYKYLHTIKSPALVGEYAILAEELKQWVKADSQCNVYFIPVCL